MNKKDILERAIDYQYQSSIWGIDDYSVAAYKLMMKNSGGIYPEIEAYRLDDQESWKDAFEKIDKVVKLLEAGKGYKLINKKDSKLWYDTIKYIEGIVGYGSLTLNIKNKLDKKESMDNELKIAKMVAKRLRKKLIDNRKLINKIHDNKYRWAFHIVFKEKKSR